MRAYLTVKDRKGKRLGAARLKRVLMEEAPGLRVHHGIWPSPYSHLGFPVILVETRYAADFREAYRKALNALQACGYNVFPQLTAAARDAVARGGF